MDNYPVTMLRIGREGLKDTFFGSGVAINLSDRCLNRLKWQNSSIYYVNGDGGFRACVCLPSPSR